MIDLEAYRSIESAQCDGSYPELLQKISPVVEAETIERVAAELEAVLRLGRPERAATLDWILRYWSRAREKDIAEGKIEGDAFEETSLRLARAAKHSRAELEAGTFDAMILAERIVDACRRYDRDVIVPITRQISRQLADDFPRANFLLLGRDFTSVYLYLVEEGSIPRERLFLANASRNVRDACLVVPGSVPAPGSNEEKLQELAETLAACGLSAEKCLTSPLVVVDSSMKGKIPAVIFRALARKMSGREAWQFLSRCHIRYLRSARHKGKELHERALEAGRDTGSLSPVQIDEMLRDMQLIEEFKGICYPPSVASYIPRRHKIFEWRPKSLQVATGTARDASGAHFTSDAPQGPGEKITCLIGLYLDVQMQASGRKERAAPVSTSTAVMSAGEDLATLRAEIDEAAKHGTDALRRWQRGKLCHSPALAIVETKQPDLPYLLLLGDKPITRLRSVAGEGNSVVAYVTENNTALKIAKHPTHARKNLLLAWAEDVVRTSGIDVAPIYTVGPAGLFVEQEYIPGENLEDRWGVRYEAEPGIVPASVKEQILVHYEKARRLIEEKGIYLDLKSANYQLRADGRIVMVDYTPRVNDTHHRYFHKDSADGGASPGRELTKEEFLDMFFRHDLRKRCARGK